nr:putative Ulp1 protease family catalytic domain-containing protein [Ipomoea batatas]
MHSFHGILTVININKDIIYMLDPLGHRIRNDDWKHAVDMAMKMFHEVGNGKKGRSKTSWEIVKAPHQPDSNQCGFYVMAYMRILIEHMPDIDDKESVQALILYQVIYSRYPEWAGSTHIRSERHRSWPRGNHHLLELNPGSPEIPPHKESSLAT